MGELAAGWGVVRVCVGGGALGKALERRKGKENGGGSGRLTPVNPPLIYIYFFISIIVGRDKAQRMNGLVGYFAFSLHGGLMFEP